MTIFLTTGRNTRWWLWWALVRKDILQAAKNPYSLSCLLVPWFLALLYSIILLANPTSNSVITLAIYNPGESQLVTALRALPEVKVIDVPAAGQLPEVVQAEADGGLEVPPGFDAAMRQGQQPGLTVYLNQQRNKRTLFTLKHLIEAQVRMVASPDTPARIKWADVIASAEDTLRKQLSLTHYLLIVLLVVTMMMAGAYLVAVLRVDEKEKRTWNALLVSPATPADVAAGKSITGLICSVVTVAPLLWLFGGWKGNWPATLVIILIGMVWMVTLGVLAGSLFHTHVALSTWGALHLMIFILPSILTSSSLPAVETAMRLIPTFYVVEALKLSLTHGPAARLWTDIAILAGLLGLTLVATVWAFRRETRREHWLDERSRQVA